MNHEQTTNRRVHGVSSSAAGFTLIELMISMTISVLMLTAMVGSLVSTSRNNVEMQKTNGLIENGRFTLQLLQNDLVHAGFWGGYVPQFDDLSFPAAPSDVPTVVPDLCQPYANWNSPYRSALVGIAVQSAEALPAGLGCIAPLSQRPGTDVLAVRHVETCVPGEGTCEADVAGRLYFQSSRCKAERNAGTALTATSNTLTLSGSASGANGRYVGLTIRTVSGVGAAQTNSVAAYNGSTHVATLSVPWVTMPDSTTTYGFEYVLGTSVFPLYQRDCVGTGSPATLPITAGTAAAKRLFVSNIYYIHDFPHPDRPGETIPTLVRSQFGVAGGLLAHQAPVALIEGIEAFRVELGIDNVSDSGDAVDYTDAIDWADADKTSPTNRGDGEPDEFIRCTTATPCTAAQLTNVVAVKLYALVRSRDATPGHTDDRTYCLGGYDSDGSCPAANTIAAANDSYKRHVFTTSVRLTNVSGRRETP
jgi:prepilin-type N-terminal cleavage/methylation domain-containing protein